MKLLLSFLLLFVGTTVWSQSNVVEDPNNPPTYAETKFTPEMKAQIKAMELLQACEIEDRKAASDLMKLFHEFEIDTSMDSAQKSEDQMTSLKEDLDKAVKEIIGNSKMAVYNEWKTKSHPWEPGNYAD
ncbi:MAG: hypothetical protein HKN32_06065 [Flavobacteriales bacterium]|nr:hypothetical protein [Flavobacteriales bacterium]